LFVLITAKAAVYRATKQTNDGAKARRLLSRLRRIVDALAPIGDESVRLQLAKWKLDRRGKPERFALPRYLPRALPEALALLERVRASGIDLRLGKPATRLPKGLPDALTEFYAHHDRLGERLIVPPGEIASMSKTLAKWTQKDEGSDEADDDAIPVGVLSEPERWVALGRDDGGDFFFLDPAWQGGEPVLRYVHDEAMTCRVEASSLASYVAAHGLGSLAEQGRIGGPTVDSAALKALVARDRALVRTRRKGR